MSVSLSKLLLLYLYLCFCLVKTILTLSQSITTGSNRIDLRIYIKFIVNMALILALHNPCHWLFWMFLQSIKIFSSAYTLSIYYSIYILISEVMYDEKVMLQKPKCSWFLKLLCRGKLGARIHSVVSYQTTPLITTHTCQTNFCMEGSPFLI